MSSLTNINNNASVVNVGRTTPVTPGAQPASKSIPVVVATDQTAIPVVEQNKIQSEVALSLLGIPRSEVALGIFADVNTYDVNPGEWSSAPAEYSEAQNTTTQYTSIGGVQGWGIAHLPEESGALVTAPADETAVLTSKRFFRYQPGRVSAATFGIKSSSIVGDVIGAGQREPVRNPPVRKYGIFDKFDGYYWETRDTSQGDQFAVVRRTQSIIRYNPLQFGNQAGEQLEDHALAGKPPAQANYSYNEYPTATSYLSTNRFSIIEDALVSNLGVKCKRDLGYFLDSLGLDMTLGTNYGATFQGLAESNSNEYPLGQTVIDAINASETAVKALTGITGVTNPTTRVTAFYDRLSAVAIDAGTRVDYTSSSQDRQIAFLKGITFTNPTSGATASQIAAKDKIQANYDFIAEDVIKYVSNNFTPPGGYNENKCKRDVLFAVNAIAYDILYGGNSATHDAARFFFYDGFDKSDQSALDIIAQTVAAYDHLISIIDNIVTNSAITPQAGNLLSQDTTGTAADSAEALRAQTLLGIIRGVINEGDILISLPADRTAPDSSWATSEYTTAQAAIQTNKDTITSNIVTITYSSDDLKCIRDMGFAIDAYVNDLQWGGNGHIISNAATYNTALLLSAEREGENHYSLRYVIRDRLNAIGEDEARTRIGELAGYQIQAVTATGTPGSKYPPQAGPGDVTGYISEAQINAADWGNRGKIETIFSVYDKYYGYLVSESISYTTEINGVVYDEDVLKYKCIRDVRFVMEAYGSDLQFGGNAATAYNAYKYYEGDTLKVFSQANGGAVAEIARHQYLKQLLTSASAVTVTKSNAATTTIASLATRFGLTAIQTTKLSTLADLIIANFSDKYVGSIEYGSAGQWGDLIILRDGLIMTHGAVYDPTLLKTRSKVLVSVDTVNDTLELTSGSVIIGQYVTYYGDATGLTDGKLYYVANVSGPKSTIIQLVDPMEVGFDPTAIRPSEFTPINITSAGTESYIETPVPFIFPDDYNQSFGLVNTEERYDGMFPYMYSSSGVLPAEQTDVTIGYIDTAIDTSADPTTLREQIDALNYKYKTWVRDHVDPTYYSVYEYRVPRSRFSGDSLDGATRNAVYSDSVLDKKAGSLYQVNGLAQEQTSVWDLDFGKVTMLKVEFSWYGAVGALFLAYVPVANGDARWVRVHHLRASNQLKISSLGNATLPITYMVYGGGSESRMGVPNADRLQNPYGSYSESIVKYGASYYIDGGDRGTVRLYNHSSDTPTEVYGSRYKLGVDQGNSAPTDAIAPFLRVNDLDPDSTGFDAPAVSTYYMNAKIITGNTQDQNVKVIWVDGDDLYLNKPISEVSSFNVIVERPALMYGLKTKDSIVSGDGNDVRNRVQVYPTRLSVGAEGSTNAKITLLKTPKFQSATPTNGTLTISTESDLNASYVISVDTQNYIRQNGEFTYGYFRASLNGSETLISVLGRLEKTNDQYFFFPIDIYNGTLVLAVGSTFLKEGVFDQRGTTLTAAETTFEKERLSSIEVSLRAQTPIPGSGTELASYYVAPGAEDFDLATYFDYNKEYISYPLTDQIETLFLATYSNNTNSETSLVSMSASLTWEEQ
jgi:hypothetical protein